MRQPLAPTFLRMLFVALALAVVGATGSPAFADGRSEARTHYQAGVKFYAGGDYRSAIREFSAAQQLAPADLNNYNLALCYDKLGDAEPAVQYYRAYLDKVPNTDKRAEIDASIARLDAAAKSAAAKKAEELRKAEDARKLADEQKRLEEARRAEDARLAAEAAARNQQAMEPRDPMMPPTGPSSGAGPGIGASPSIGVGVSTGDKQLDRVQGIDVNAIRDQRGAGLTQNGQGVATAAPPTGSATAGAPNAVNPNGQPMSGEPPKAQTPIYKKWWFWAVVAVSAYVVYQIASDDSGSSNTTRLLPEVGGAKSTAQPGGLTLMSW